MISILYKLRRIVTKMLDGQTVGLILLAGLIISLVVASGNGKVADKGGGDEPGGEG